MNIVLVGNPNTGKTTLYNGLTKSSEHTGNWHGVTVDEKIKSYTYKNKKFNVVDLPGVYSLTPMSFEEKVTSDYLFSLKDYLIVNLIDYNTIEKNLYLTMELIRLNVPMIIVLNNIGNMKNKSYSINAKKLQETLGVCVVEMDTKNKQDIIKLKENIYNFEYNKNLKNNNKNIKNNEKIEKLMQKIKKIIDFSANNLKISERFVLKKCLECDENIVKKLKLSNEKLKELESVQREICIDDIIEDDYKNIKKILLESNTKKINNVYGKSWLDKIILNKYLCIPILMITLVIIFYLTFFSVGKFFSEGLSYFVENVFGKWFLGVIKNITSNKIIYDFFSVAIVSGLGSIFSFLPQVVVLFVCLGILEDSGYLSRIAFCLDDIFAKVGLSGKSVYTLIMGFGCSAVSCLSARTMDDKNSKIKTAMLAPYMSCSAKLPLYSVIGSAFFGASNVFVIFAMYLLGVVVALLLSVFYEKHFLKSGKTSFIFEFPPYRIVSIKRLGQIALDNAKQFLVRVGSLLISINIIVWIFSNFSFSFKYVGEFGGQSIMETIGRFIAPIFTPLGFGTWGASSALIAGLVAKEIIVSSIAMINGVFDVDKNMHLKISESLTNTLSPICFTPASAISYMVFCLLYCPCIATMSVLKKEVGKKWFIISVFVQFFVAYVISFIIYSCMNIILNKGILYLLIYFAVTFLCLYSIVVLCDHLKKRKCGKCQGCKK